MEPRGRRLPGEGSATFPTELGRGEILKAALTTAHLEGHAALPAKLRPLGIVRATVCTLHAASLLPLPVDRQDKCLTRQEVLSTVKPTALMCLRGCLKSRLVKLL